MLNLDISFEHQGRVIAADTYGKTYLKQFAEVIEKFKPSRQNLSMLEWGSGLTSLLIDSNKRDLGIDYFLTLDDGKDYADSVRRALKTPNSKLVCIGQTGPCVNQHDEGLNYSTYPLSESISFDIIFIDGRRRMECSMMALLLGPRDQTVIIHDYRRARYQPILAFYDVIEDGEQFRVLRPNPKIHEAVHQKAESVRSLMVPQR